MEISKKLLLNKSKQLFDIHGNIKNFKTFIDIQTDSDDIFQYAIINQTELDSDKDINYKNAKKNVSDIFEYNGSDYQNHFISLRSESNVTILLHIKTISVENLENNENKLVVSNQNNETQKKSFTSTLAFKLFIIFGVSFLIYFIYIKFFKKDSMKNSTERRVEKSPVRNKINIDILKKNNSFKPTVNNNLKSKDEISDIGFDYTNTQIPSITQSITQSITSPQISHQTSITSPQISHQTSSQTSSQIPSITQSQTSPQIPSITQSQTSRQIPPITQSTQDIGSNDIQLKFNQQMESSSSKNDTSFDVKSSYKSFQERINKRINNK
jgi:hypothetical protein